MAVHPVVASMTKTTARASSMRHALREEEEPKYITASQGRTRVGPFRAGVRQIMRMG
jgi:hypothetical protein